MNKPAVAIGIYAFMVVLALSLGNLPPASVGKALTWSVLPWVMLYFDRQPYIKTMGVGLALAAILLVGGSGI